MNVSLYFKQYFVKQHTPIPILHLFALETMNARYPELRWLRIFLYAGTTQCWYCSFLQPFCLLYSNGTAYDGEIKAICVTLEYLFYFLDKFTEANILSDSKAALCSEASQDNLSSRNILNRQNSFCKLHHLDKFSAPIPMDLRPLQNFEKKEGDEWVGELTRKRTSIQQTNIRSNPFLTLTRIIKAKVSTGFNTELMVRTNFKKWREPQTKQHP